MKKQYRVKKEKDFQTILRTKNSYANRQFVVYVYEKEGQEHFRLGVSVGKRIGNAVMRNKVKRYIREVFKNIGHKLEQNKDYIVIARVQTATMNYEEIEKSLKHVLKKAKVFKEKS
ncbi:MAG TPA: ribonuclease P protein component [Massilibacterium sp.]|nr:ribonuclease P protein component [Massilibacterium sp.]